MIPKNITKEHIESAIQEIDVKGVRKGRDSSAYDLVINGKTYPPKLVISIANRFANGVELDANEFQGGLGSQSTEILKKYDFEIIPKNDPIKSLIENYKALLSTSKLDDEKYKWELVKEFEGRPDINSPDFTEEIKGIKYQNLIYQMGIAVIHHLAKDKPEELRTLFRYLFDKNKDLSDRVAFFNEETLKLYREIGETLNHHQDERSIATYLTFYDSHEYTFYKSSFYKKLCKLLGIKEEKKNKKYVHYLGLVDQLIKNYIEPDNDLINQVKTLLPEYYDGINHKLLVQDILYQMLDKKAEVNYWIFQGNPKFYDVESALNDGAIKTWNVKAHKDKIRIGDKIILWVTGINNGCYAVGEVISDVYEGLDEEEEMKYYTENSENVIVDKVKIDITHNCASNPVTKEQIDIVDGLKDLKIGNQGTNFSATKAEYNSLVKLIESQLDDFQLFITRFSEDDLNTFFGFLREIISTFKLSRDDERLVFSIKGNSLNFTIGQRYCFNLFASETKGKYGVISQEKLNEQSNAFSESSPPPYYTYYEGFNPSSSDKKSIFEAIRIELERTSKSGFRKYNDTDFENHVSSSEAKISQEKMNLSLNTILYGPPGTGKTYKLKNEFFEKFTTSESTKTQDEYVKEKIENLSWWEVIALVILDLGKTKVSNIFNHKLIKLKAEASNSTTVTPTIWGKLQYHTLDECEYVNVKKRSQIQIFNKTKNSEWEIVLSKVEEQVPELLILKADIDSFKPTQISKKRYVFTTFHQSFGYEDFIEGIKPIIYENEQNPEIGKQVIYDIKPGIFKQIVKDAISDRENDYAIFIDEINRGNIANIFGELITLIEEDKRIGRENYIPAKLPYSGDQFGVPPNLYIIGTMNTADRSVEALDTALRRRFSFIEMSPEPRNLSLPEFICNGIDLEKMLIAINGRIEKLLDKDYCIGHSYFMTIQNQEQPLEEIKVIFQNRILPLLQEYFFGDWGKIMLVIGNDFIEKKVETIKFLSTDSYEEFEEYDEKPIYSFTESRNWTLDSFKSIYE